MRQKVRPLVALVDDLHWELASMLLLVLLHPSVAFKTIDHGILGSLSEMDLGRYYLTVVPILHGWPNSECSVGRILLIP